MEIILIFTKARSNLGRVLRWKFSALCFSSMSIFMQFFILSEFWERKLCFEIASITNPLIYQQIFFHWIHRKWKPNINEILLNNINNQNRIHFIGKKFILWFKKSLAHIHGYASEEARDSRICCTRKINNGSE